MAQPRTRDTQAIQSRPARGKYGLHSRQAMYTSRGADTVPGYVASMYPGLDRATHLAMTNAINRYLATDDGIKYGMPTPTQCTILFEGLI